MQKLATLVVVGILGAPTAYADRVPSKAKMISKAQPAITKLSKPTTPPIVLDSDGDGFADPPADDAAYPRWLRSLPSDERRKISRFCRANPTEYQAVCGGIGPLHIPRPPSMVKSRAASAADNNPFEDREQWHAALTRTQRAYVDRFCHREDFAYTELCGATPLVVAFDDQPVAFMQAPGRFELRAGDPVATDWPTAATPWLAIDLDGDGAITTGAELFGGGSVLLDGSHATHGFEALAIYDANHDGRIDREDPMFAALLLWADRDGDRKSSPDELVPARDMIDSISLAYRIEARCDVRMNCERERSQLTWRDPAGTRRNGAVVDVYLRYRDGDR